MITMFVVEDNKFSLDYIAEGIEWENYGISIAGKAVNGMLAWEAIKKLCPDIVLTDIRMPVLDGLGLIEKIRSSEMDTQVIILSAHDDFAYAQRAIKMQITDYVLKPVEDELLIEAVEKAKQNIIEKRENEAYKRKLEENEAEFSRLRSSYFWEELSGLCEKVKGVEKTEVSAVQQAVLFVEKHYMEELTVELVAGEVGLTPNYFSHIFKQAMEVSFSAFLRELRIEKAKELLKETEMKSAEISRIVGFADQQYFTRTFKKVTGYSPVEYRKNVKDGTDLEYDRGCKSDDI